MNLKVGPYQLRHSSALNEWISRWRTSEEIMKRGRATRSTIRASLEYGRFSLVIRQHCESCERLSEAAFLGKVNTRWPPRQQPYKALLRPTVFLGIVSKAVFKGGLQTVERTNSCEFELGPSCSAVDTSVSCTWAVVLESRCLRPPTLTCCAHKCNTSRHYSDLCATCVSVSLTQSAIATDFSSFYYRTYRPP